MVDDCYMYTQDISVKACAQKWYMHKLKALSEVLDLFIGYIFRTYFRLSYRIGLIYRKFYRLCNTSTLRKLYLTLVRLILEYCCHVWDPFLHKDIELLESVQKFAVKVCTKRWREAYNYLRNLLKLPLLKDLLFVSPPYIVCFFLFIIILL